MDILDEIKTLTKFIKKADNVELYKSISDVKAEVLGLLEENSRLSEENNSLKEEVGQLKEKLRIMSSIRLENSVYWIFGGKDIKDGPFCPNCWDTEQVLVRMVEDFIRNLPYNKCPTCKIVVRAKK